MDNIMIANDGHESGAGYPVRQNTENRDSLMIADNSASFKITIVFGEDKATAVPVSRWTQYLVPVLGALIAVSLGYIDAWSATAWQDLQGPVQDSALPLIVDPIGVPNLSEPLEGTPAKISLIRGIAIEEAFGIAALVPVGSMLGAISALYFADFFGPKKTLLASTIPCLLSWIIIVFYSNSIALLCLTRGIAGIVMGIIVVVVPHYSEEMTQGSVRGDKVMVTIGILFSYIVGTFFPYNWTAIIPCAISIAMFVLLYCMPESPTFGCGMEG